MSHKHGTYMGGIRTVECLRQRSHVDPITGCWHWGLSMTKGVPILHLVLPDTAERVKMRGRRAALYLDRGHDLAEGHSAFAKVFCTSPDCVNPEHSRAGSRAEFGKWLAKSGKLKDHARKAEISRKMWDERGRKLKPEQVLQIRASTDSTYALAAEFGVSQCAVWLARRGKTHRHLGLVGKAASSVFNFRP